MHFEFLISIKDQGLHLLAVGGREEIAVTESIIQVQMLIFELLINDNILVKAQDLKLPHGHVIEQSRRMELVEIVQDCL